MNLSGRKSKSSPLAPSAYQLVPLVKLLQNELKAVLISDGVGVGKTISAGYILSFLQGALNRPSLVVCPPMLVDKWLLELRGKFDAKAIPIRSAEELPTAISETQLSRGSQTQIYVMANSLLTQKSPLDFRNLGLVVFDEIHNYRNHATLSYKTALGLAENAANRIGLSATPINNSIEDLVSELSILLPEIGREVLDLAVMESWTRAPETVTLPLVTRFTKERLGIHFARRSIRHHLISYPTGYNERVLSVIQTAREKYSKKASFFDDVTYFRMAASSPVAISKALDHDFNLKIDPKLEMLIQIVSDSPSSHILMFCEFEDTALYVAKNIIDRECFVITGGIPLFERQPLIEAFKQSEKGLLIMTPVGTEGLDMQFCDTLVNYDLHWNPMKIEQRIGRIDRIGQTKKEIYIANFVVENSIDARVISVLWNKLRIIAKSVFETGEIIRSESPQGLMLADAQSIEKEVTTGRDLISAITFSQTIPESDYEVLKYVKIEYCLPAAIREAGKRNLRSEGFLEYCKESENWLRLNSEKAGHLRDLVKFYK